jgi:hypothetical protein
MILSFAHQVSIMDRMRDLVSTAVDVQLAKQDLIQMANVDLVKPEIEANRTIPVFLPKKRGTVDAFVSEEDFDKISSASKKWRQSSSGYPIFVKKQGDKFVTTYMHKLVFGGPARHVNGNRLDNTRANLTISNKNSTKVPVDVTTIVA